MRAWFKALASRFGGAEDGVAAVEFALIMPFLLALYFGSMEASVLFMADKRINTVSATLGDLVSQWDPNDGKIPTATLTTYFAAGPNILSPNAATSPDILSPYSTSGLKQVVSLIFVDSSGTTKVLWSKTNGTGAVARTVGQPYAPLNTSSTTDIVARGGCIVAAESSYAYKPLFGQMFSNTFNLAHTNYFIPRFGATGVINLEDTSLSSTACTTGS
ncbi:MAG: TadE/TadG family type IV pilus assembly protein [Devosia sp.]|jgi:Flp pilus assembly protein TadG